MYLYHYGKTETIFNILQGKSIRLSDIRKSNDYKEMELFYPDILYSIWECYCNNPFPLRYEGKHDKDALYELIDSTRYIINSKLDKGSLTNYVACFSEKADLLSQWRGYADLGKGCCLGFERHILEEYCNLGDVLRLEKVEYLNPKQVEHYISKFAQEAVKDLQGLREWIASEMTSGDDNPETDGLLGFNFSRMIENFLNDSLKYKQIGFKEEAEWRLFLHNPAYKYEDLLFGANDKITGPAGFESTINYIKRRIDFSITSDNIVPYISISFDEFRDNPVRSIWLGPKNKIAEQDLKMYLKKNGYDETEIKRSGITFI